MNTGYNITFPIKSSDGTSFHDLVLRKATVESVVMSLSDKITGDVYYKDNSLAVTMQEYIEYDGVHYVLVNPPTIVREGMVSDNSELKGMTKYSFTFYHPMYVLGNFPFSDVAVSNDEKRYLSENKKFSWIGTPDDYIDKLNKNLEHKEWIVIKSERFPQEKDDELSEVLSFDNNTIADALKIAYDTWEVPFIIDQIKEGEEHYSDGKRFKILFGLPSNEIYATPQDEQDNHPFVFYYGQGVGLKNNSRNPRNNKIITRISGTGSENNIPYDYPQIEWYGDANLEYTYGNDVGVYYNVNIQGHVFTKLVSYPIYKGILGGQYVELIKHPFTRNTLMPSVYRTTLFNKVSFFNEDGTPNVNYNPDIELVDFYDAIYSEQYPYPNTINLYSPSYEAHQFEDVKPELGEEFIVNAVPVNQDLSPTDKWDDSIDDDGNFVQSYFKLTLPRLSFDLYACAAITEEMQINMRSGACIGCTFPVQVDWEDYKLNFYDYDGNFDPVIGQGHPRNAEKYPDTTQSNVDVIVQKEQSTFGTIMPNIYQQPQANDQFVILGISLPQSYVDNAEQRLDEEMKSYMLENNVHYYDYPLKFDEYFLIKHSNILSQIRPNSIIHFGYSNDNLELFVKQISIKYGDAPLPQYDITLTDNIEVVLNQIGQVADDVEKLSSLISIIRQNYRRNVWVELSKKLSKAQDDSTPYSLTAKSFITSGGGFKSKDFAQGASGSAIWQDEDGNWHYESDFIHVRKKFTAKELQIEHVNHIGGQQLLTAASMTCDFVIEKENVWRCFFLKVDGTGKEVTNKWKINDQAFVNTFNLVKQEDGSIGNHYLWRLVVATSNDTSDESEYVVNGETLSASDYHFIDLSKYVASANSDAPFASDAIVQLGNQSGDGIDNDRKNAIIIAGAGTGSPYIQQFVGINSFSLPQPDTQIKPNANLFTGVVNMQSGSSIDNSVIQEHVKTGWENILINSGFTGDYESIEMSANRDVSDDSILFSDPLGRWEYENVEIVEEPIMVSGFAAQCGTLSQVVDGELEENAMYMLSFVAMGTSIQYSIAGVTGSINLTNEFQRYNIPIVCVDASATTATFIGDNCTIGDLQIRYGTIPVAWGQNSKENDKVKADFAQYDYLKSAILNGSTEILGGLILSQLIKVGIMRDTGTGSLIREETGGMSGLYNDDNSPFLWGGGDLSSAIYTIMKYAYNPKYQASDEELANMANFVVTHGGRAILNDVILRGYIYALGGVFNGTVYANNGRFNGEVNANAGTFENVNIKAGCKVGKFNIYTDGISYDGDGNASILISKANNYQAFIGADALPGTLSPMTASAAFRNERQNNVGSTIGLIASADNGIYNEAIRIEKGHIAGFKTRTRVVSQDVTLTLLEHTIFANNGCNTITLPNNAEDGQEYLIKTIYGVVDIVCQSGDVFGQWIGGNPYPSRNLSYTTIRLNAAKSTVLLIYSASTTPKFWEATFIEKP